VLDRADQLPLSRAQSAAPIATMEAAAKRCAVPDGGMSISREMASLATLRPIVCTP